MVTNQGTQVLQGLPLVYVSFSAEINASTSESLIGIMADLANKSEDFYPSAPALTSVLLGEHRPLKLPRRPSTFAPVTTWPFTGFLPVENTWPGWLPARGLSSAAFDNTGHYQTRQSACLLLVSSSWPKWKTRSATF